MYLRSRPIEFSPFASSYQGSLGDLPRPNWLKEGEYDGPTWVVGDDLPSSPKPYRPIRWDLQLYDPKRPNQICLLTDPEYSPLLDTAKRQSFGLRTGRYATVSSADTHEEMSRTLVNMIIWMIQNSIYRYSHLNQDDFDFYLNAARFGPGHLLGYAVRLSEFVTRLKQEGGAIPTIKRSNALPYLDTARLLQDAGIDPIKGGRDKAASFELAQLAKNEGLYLSPIQRRRLARGAPSPKKLVTIPLMRMLQPWEYQWRMRRSFPGDHLQFNPFEGVTVLQVSQELGEKLGRTRTSPVTQTMELIDRSIRWVLDYGPALLDITEQHFELVARGLPKKHRLDLLQTIISETVIPDGPGTPLPLSASTKNTFSSGLDFGVAVNRFIPTACSVVICAFSGRRHDEVLTVRAAGQHNDHCISKDQDGFWIETFIEKTSQDWIKTPCNEVVAAAAELLERWSARAREISGRPNLFQLKRLVDERVATFRLGKALNDFVRFLQLSPQKEGTQWTFTPHQFRRFFAILYFWGYRYRNLAALSHHYRHLDPAMTQIYVTEQETGAIFREVDKQHTVDLLSETALGERNLTGPFAERFKKVAIRLYRRYRRSTKVVTPNLVRKVVERYVNKSRRRLKVMPWGMCCVLPSPHELNQARCLRNQPNRIPTGPDFSNSSPTICCECPYHATEQLFEPFLRSQLQSHERAAADPQNSAIMRAASREHAERLRLHCNRSFQESKALEVPDA